MPPANQQNNVYPAPQATPPMAGFDPTQPVPKPKHHINSLLIPLVLAVLLLLCAIGFGAWSFASRQDYKDNSDQKSARAVAVAEANLTKKKDAEFVEKEKEPLKEFKGPAAFGSVNIKYPKTWSGFVTLSDRSATPVDGYFHPDVVPGLESGTAFALHVQVTNTAYAQELKKFESDTKAGKVKVSAIVAPKVPNVAGVRVDGQIAQNKQGSMVLFPLRDKTLKVITESDQYAKDFNDIIIANLVFAP